MAGRVVSGGSCRTLSTPSASVRPRLRRWRRNHHRSSWECVPLTPFPAYLRQGGNCGSDLSRNRLAEMPRSSRAPVWRMRRPADRQSVCPSESAGHDPLGHGVDLGDLGFLAVFTAALTAIAATAIERRDLGRVNAVGFERAGYLPTGLTGGRPWCEPVGMPWRAQIVVNAAQASVGWAGSAWKAASSRVRSSKPIVGRSRQRRASQRTAAGA